MLLHSATVLHNLRQIIAFCGVTVVNLSLLCIVQCHKKAKEAQQNGYLVIIRDAQNDLLLLVFIIYDHSGPETNHAKRRTRSLIVK